MAKEKLDIGRRVYERKQTAKGGTVPKAPRKIKHKKKIIEAEKEKRVRELANVSTKR